MEKQEEEATADQPEKAQGLGQYGLYERLADTLIWLWDLSVLLPCRIHGIEERSRNEWLQLQLQKQKRLQELENTFASQESEMFELFITGQHTIASTTFQNMQKIQQEIGRVKRQLKVYTNSINMLEMREDTKTMRQHAKRLNLILAYYNRYVDSNATTKEMRNLEDFEDDAYSEDQRMQIVTNRLASKQQAMIQMNRGDGQSLEQNMVAYLLAARPEEMKLRGFHVVDAPSEEDEGPVPAAPVGKGRVPVRPGRGKETQASA